MGHTTFWGSRIAFVRERLLLIELVVCRSTMMVTDCRGNEGDSEMTCVIIG